MLSRTDLALADDSLRSFLEEGKVALILVLGSEFSFPGRGEDCLLGLSLLFCLVAMGMGSGEDSRPKLPESNVVAEEDLWR